MTNLEAFLSQSGDIIDSASAASLLSFNGIDPDETWDATNQEAKCKLYAVLLGALARDQYNGITSITQSGFQIVLDKNEKANTLYNMALDSGCPDLINKYSPDAANSVTYIGNRW